MCAAVAAAVPGLARLQAAQSGQTPQWNEQPRAPVGEQLPGMPSRFWIQLIGDDGRLPDRERLVVLTTDGRVLGVVDGDDCGVRFPPRIDALLSSGSVHVVLAHNHPKSTSLSGADLALLGRRGVERVVAVGNDGSVYEATAGRRFVEAATVARLFPEVEARVRARLPLAAMGAGVPAEAGFDYFSHLVASAFARANVIDYRWRMSASAAAGYVVDAAWLDRIVSSETAHLLERLPR